MSLPESHEVYDTEIIEAIGQTFQSCVFFACEFTGSGNTFIDCRFQKITCPVMSGSKFINCAFFSSDPLAGDDVLFNLP